mgnify:CR=1 FL=1
MERGGQPGNQNAVKAKRWQQAIDRKLEINEERSNASVRCDQLEE